MFQKSLCLKSFIEFIFVTLNLFLLLNLFVKFKQISFKFILSYTFARPYFNDIFHMFVMLVLKVRTRRFRQRNSSFYSFTRKMGTKCRSPNKIVEEVMSQAVYQWTKALLFMIPVWLAMCLGLKLVNLSSSLDSTLIMIVKLLFILIFQV